MYGRYVTLDLGDDCMAKVWVWGVPSMPESEFEARARTILARRLAAGCVTV